MKRVNGSQAEWDFPHTPKCWWNLLNEDGAFPDFNSHSNSPEISDTEDDLDTPYDGKIVFDRNRRTRRGDPMVPPSSAGPSRPLSAAPQEYPSRPGSSRQTHPLPPLLRQEGKYTLKRTPSLPLLPSMMTANDSESMFNQTVAVRNRYNIVTKSKAETELFNRVQGMVPPFTGPELPGGQVGFNDRLNIDHFHQLMKAFLDADEDGSGGLDLDEFRLAFGSILGKDLNDHQMVMLFMKIDANADGTVDWDEFCTYMILEKQGSISMQEEERSTIFALKDSVSHRLHHKDVLVGVEYIQADKKYISISRDCGVCVWTSGFAHIRTLSLIDETVCGSNPWLMAFCYNQTASTLIASFDDRSIGIFEHIISQRGAHKTIFLTSLDYVPLCIDIASAGPNGLGRERIAFGDDGGFVNQLEFSNPINTLPAKVGLFGAEAHGIRHTKIKTHSDWVMDIQHIPELNSYVTCVASTTRSLVLTDVQNWNQRFADVKQGVNCFCYMRKSKLLVTGGCDRMIRLWNPYVLSRSTAMLRGHQASVVHMACSKDEIYLVTASVDYIIRIWDVVHNQCLQKFSRDPLTGREYCLKALGMFEEAAVLVTSDFASLTVWPMIKQETSAEPKSHDQPLSMALYNVNFKQVVSGSTNGTFLVWDLHTGRKIYKYKGSMDELTCMSFDSTGRRLIAGCNDGSLMVYNFNNGACLKELVKGASGAVTNITNIVLWLKTYIVVSGWGGKIFVYDESIDSDTVEPTRILPNTKDYGGGHNDEILAQAFCRPNTLVTSCIDGEIIVWNFDSGFEKFRMNRATATRTPEMCRERAAEKLMFLEQRPGTGGAAALLSLGADDVIRVWNVNTGEETWSVEANHTTGSVLSAIALTMKHKMILTGDSCGGVKVWDITNLVNLDAYNAAESSVVPMASFRKRRNSVFSRRMSTAPRSDHLIEERSCFRGHMSAVVSLSFVDEQELILSASVDCTVRMWSVRGVFIGIFGNTTGWNASFINVAKAIQTTDSKHMPSDVAEYIKNCKEANEAELAEQHRKEAITRLHFTDAESELLNAVFAKWTQIQTSRVSQENAVKKASTMWLKRINRHKEREVIPWLKARPTFPLGGLCMSLHEQHAGTITSLKSIYSHIDKDNIDDITHSMKRLKTTIIPSSDNRRRSHQQCGGWKQNEALQKDQQQDGSRNKKIVEDLYLAVGVNTIAMIDDDQSADDAHNRTRRRALKANCVRASTKRRERVFKSLHCPSLETIKTIGTMLSESESGNVLESISDAKALGPCVSAGVKVDPSTITRHSQRSARTELPQIKRI